MSKETPKVSINEQRYRVLIDSAPEVVLVFDVDSGCFIDANRAAMVMLKFSREELLQLGPSDISPTVFQGVSAIDKAQEYIQNALNGGNPSFEWVHLDRNAREIPCEIRLIRFPPYDKSIVRASIIDLTEKKKMEAALVKSEERLQLALNANGLGCFDWSPQDNSLHWDAGMYELFGLDPSSTINRNDYFFQCVHPDDQERVATSFQSILTPQSTQSVFEDQYRIIKDLRVNHVLTKGVVKRNENGEVERVTGTVQNITDQIEMQLALQKSEELFRTVFDQQFQFMAILSPEGRVLEINDLPIRVSGAKHEEFIGSFFWNTPTWSKLPEWQFKIKNQIMKASQTQEPHITEDAFLTAEGELRWADTAYTAIREENNKVRFILVQANDITERKRSEENLRKAQQELSKLANRFQISTRAAQLGIWDWQIQKNQLIWDETMLGIYGLSPKQFPNRMEDWKPYLLPEDTPIFQEMIDWDSTSDNELNMEFRIRRPDGAIRHIKAVASIQRGEKGANIGVIGANWDVTQEKEAEQERIRARQLELRNRELEQFAYVASHDLQEPLRTVISFVGLLRRAYKDKLDERANEYIQFVVEASSRMSQLIKGLLDYSRIGTNRELSLVDCTALVQQILNDLSAQISNTEAVIKMEPLPQIKGYETEMRMLFQNLISNAIKFHREDQHPIIHISVRENEKQWVFSVKDNGIGIDSMYLDQIFVLFQRLHGREEYKGTGIGLAHCQKIVDLHGGTIWVTSELNKGCTFYFSISKSEKVLE